MKAKLSVVCQRQRTGSYYAICPEVRGCYTQGDTYEQALLGLRELVEITLSEEVNAAERAEMSNEKQYIFSEMLVELAP
jgi:predicted RNase H-like HicB family nuclease